jgi:hypothetical protein
MSCSFMRKVTISLVECRELMLIVATLRFVRQEDGELGVGKLVQRKVDVMSRRTGIDCIGAFDVMDMFFLDLVSQTVGKGLVGFFFTGYS